MSSLIILFRHSRLLGSMICAILLMAASQAFAWDSVQLVYQRNPASDAFLSALESEWGQSSGNPALKVTLLDKFNPSSLEPNTLVIAAGMQGCAVTAERSPTNAPIFCTLVPQLAYQQMLKKSRHDPSSISALFIDQPLARQLRLFKTVLPEAKTVSILLGKQSIALKEPLTNEANKIGINLNIQIINAKEEINAILPKTLATGSGLLAIADADIYNKETAASIILTSYRLNRPIIAFSQAYVKAGAVVALFSTPELLAKQVSNIFADNTHQASKNTQTLPPSQYPQTFAIEVNKQVAHSLGLDLPENNQLIESILRNE